jgi:hypothetical protein
VSICCISKALALKVNIFDYFKNPTASLIGYLTVAVAAIKEVENIFVLISEPRAFQIRIHSTVIFLTGTLVTCDLR